MDLTKLFSPEITAAIVGALAAFLLATLWQIYTERRNKVQLTYFKKIESPLNVAKSELKDKLQIFYNNNEIKNVYSARLTIKNTGQKTIKNQIFTCSFSENSKSIDSRFPLITTIPEAEIPVRKIPYDEQNDYQPNLYRYQIDVLSPNQNIQIDFLFDGDTKDFKVLFRPNEIDEVKIVEGSSLADPNLESYIVQLGFDFLMYIVLFNVGNTFGFAGSIIVVLFALPFLYNAFVTFRKLVPLILESKLLRNEPPNYQIEIGNEASSGILIGNGSVSVKPVKSKKEKNKKVKQ